MVDVTFRASSLNLIAALTTAVIWRDSP